LQKLIESVIALLKTCIHDTVLKKSDQPGENMSNQHSVTKRHRRPKSPKRSDSTAKTMAAIKRLETADKKKEK
jgi:hypothetical protein